MVLVDTGSRCYVGIDFPANRLAALDGFMLAFYHYFVDEPQEKTGQLPGRLFSDE